MQYAQTFIEYLYNKCIKLQTNKEFKQKFAEKKQIGEKKSRQLALF